MKNLFFFGFLMLVFACNQESKDPSATIDKTSSKLYRDAKNLVEQVDKDLNNGNNPTLLHQAASLFLQNEQPKKAAQTLNKALKMYPEHPQTQKNAMLLVDVFAEHFPESGNANVLRKAFITAYPTHEKAAYYRTDLGKDEAPILVQLDSLKSTFADSLSTNTEQAVDFITYAEIFALLNTKHEASSNLIEDAAAVSASLGNIPKAVELYDWIYSLYPDSSALASKALLNKGFLYDSELNKKDKARECYEQYLVKYPESPMVESVKFLLENLEKSDEELIKMLEERSKQQGKES